MFARRLLSASKSMRSRSITTAFAMHAVVELCEATPFLILFGNLVGGCYVRARQSPIKCEPSTAAASKKQQFEGLTLFEVIVVSVLKGWLYGLIAPYFWMWVFFKWLVYPPQLRRLRIDKKYPDKVFNENGIIPHFIPNYQVCSDLLNE